MTATNVLRKRKELEQEPELVEYLGVEMTPEQIKAVKSGHMVVMKSLQNRLVSNTSGHAKRVEANVPTLMPRSLVQDAMAVGMVPIKAEDATFVEALQRTKQDFAPGLRKVIILMAMKEIYDRNDPSQFTGAGQPKPEILNDLVGFDVAVKERQNLWQELNTLIKSDLPLPTHPNADVVYKIINAEDRNELIGIAEEMGFDKDKVEGLVNRDLRFMMLKTYSNE